MPGMPLLPTGTYRLARGQLANQLGHFLLTATQAWDARRWEPVWVTLTLSFPVSLSLSLALPPCFPFLCLG
jgi:hypothetical protein